MFRTTMLTALVLPVLAMGSELAQAGGFGGFIMPPALPPTPHLSKLPTRSPRQLPPPSRPVGKAFKQVGYGHPNVPSVYPPHPHVKVYASPSQVGRLLPHGSSSATVSAGHPAPAVFVRPPGLSTAAASKSASKVPARLALRDGVFGSSDPIGDGLSSLGDLVTNPGPTIGTGIGQILTGGKGFHPDTQDTDWGPPDPASSGQQPSQSSSLHSASQDQAQLWTARSNFISAKHAWEALEKDHASPQQVSAAYQKMHAAGKMYQQLTQQGNGNHALQLGIRPFHLPSGFR